MNLHKIYIYRSRNGNNFRLLLCEDNLYLTNELAPNGRKSFGISKVMKFNIGLSHKKYLVEHERLCNVCNIL